MKRALAVGCLVLLAAGSSWAMNTGLGGYVYWNTVHYSTPSTIRDYQLVERLYVSDLWAIGTRTTVDNVPDVNQADYLDYDGLNRNLEIFDPRHEGGTGDILMVAHINHVPASNVGLRDEPWDILRIDLGADVDTPVITRQILCDGKIQPGNEATEWHTVNTRQVLKAPEGWGGRTTSGLSMVITRHLSQHTYHLFDTDGDGKIDNDTTEGSGSIHSGGDTGSAREYEFGPDDALYVSGRVPGYSDPAIRRVWMNGSATPTLETYYKPADPARAFIDNITNVTGYMGLAIRPSTDCDVDAPIVYYGCRTTVAGVQRVSIVAFQDLDDDNVITSADLMQIVWRNGMVGLDLGSTYCDHSSSVGDIERDPVSNSLFFNNSWGQLYILALSDNGFLATDYVKGPGAVAPNPKVTSTSGFELDMNPLVVPEPTTLLLVGTGLLAGLRGLRHRRRK